MSNIIEREITQGFVPIGTPKAYQYDASLVESAKATVEQGLITIAQASQTVAEEIGTYTQQKEAELDSYTITKKNEIDESAQTTLQNYVDQASASAETARELAEGVASLTEIGVDTTLTITGAGADAKVTGDYIRALEKDIVRDNSYDVLLGAKRVDRTYNGVTFTWNTDGSCKVSEATSSSGAFCNMWQNPDGWLPHLEKGKPYILYFNGTNVSFEIYPYRNGVLGSRLYNVQEPTFVTIPNDVDGLLIRLYVAPNTEVNETVNPMLLNVESNQSLYDRALLGFSSRPANGGLSNNADEILRNSICFSSVSGGVSTITNTPYDGVIAGWLVTYSSNIFLQRQYYQIFYPYAGNRPIKSRYRKTDETWTTWTEISGSGSTTYNTTQEITQVANTNTYNATISPTITTDDNGWLQPVDTNTEDETGKTDMTSAIMGMLNSTGYCHLAPGIFYVSGNIDMPEGSTLEGCGKDTIIRLLSSVSAGYCVRMGRYNTVKNISFSGGYSNFEPTTTTIGGRNGVIFIANKDGQEASQPNVTPCMLTQCWFKNFNGSAIYGHNSGGSLTESMIVSSCYIFYCEAGINLDYYTEYHKFTNIIISHCYYACINNGGNNVFTGCTFHGTIGYLMDNSSGTKRNNSHGSVVGCTFNHIDSWNRPDELGMGEAIKLIGSSVSGFIFSGCQIWYGSIKVQNGTKGIGFYNCLIGGNTPEITVSNDSTAFFGNCVFRQYPSLNVGNSTIFNNCYLASNGAVISN